jgi:hypothetical protein
MAFECLKFYKLCGFVKFVFIIVCRLSFVVCRLRASKLTGTKRCIIRVG